MSANANYSDILATTIESRSRKIADNVTNNNAILKRLSQKGKIKTFSGGHKIIQELSFSENSNAGWYSGYDLLPVGTSEVISAAEFDIKQAAVPVVISGLEQLQNAGRERMIDLMESRLEVAESTLANLITGGLYSDGLGAGGKEITGLQAAVPVDPSNDTYGNIASATYGFWRNAATDLGGSTLTAANIQGYFNGLWAQLVRGQDRPDLIMADNGVWTKYVESLQSSQRFTNTNSADSGFVTVKYMDADVVLDGGMYDATGSGQTTGALGAPGNTAYFLNCNYLHYRPHTARNMVPLSPNRRYATNQDAEVQIIGWAGNLTCSGRKFQGILDDNA
jgi:hypothetical protein